MAGWSWIQGAFEKIWSSLTALSTNIASNIASSRLASNIARSGLVDNRFTTGLINTLASLSPNLRSDAASATNSSRSKPDDDSPGGATKDWSSN